MKFVLFHSVKEVVGIVLCAILIMQLKYTIKASGENVKENTEICNVRFTINA